MADVKCRILNCLRTCNGRALTYDCASVVTHGRDARGWAFQMEPGTMTIPGPSQSPSHGLYTPSPGGPQADPDEPPQ